MPKLTYHFNIKERNKPVIKLSKNMFTLTFVQW